MRAINLLPSRVEEAATPGRWLEDRRRAGAVAGAALVVFGAGVGVVHHSMSSAVASRRAELDRLQAQLVAARHASARPAVSPRDTADEARATLVTQAAANRSKWDRLLRELALVLPSDVWLSDLKAQSSSGDDSATATSTSGTSTGDTTAAAFVIQGSTYSQDAVARLLSRLQLIPDLVDVRLQQSGSSEHGGAPLGRSVDFTITAGIRPAAGGS